MPRGIPNNRKKDNLLDDILRKKPGQQLPAEAATVNLAPPPPPAPEPPNPVVLALQEQILDLVTRRTGVQDQIAIANGRLRMAEAEAVSSRERLQQIEGEVQYRLQLIERMQGGKISPDTTNQLLSAAANIRREDYDPYSTSRPSPTPFDFSRVPQAGMGSIPAQRPPVEGVVGEVRQESAEDMRRAM